MTAGRVGGLVAAAIIILVLGIILGSRLTAPSGSQGAPTAGAPTSVPTSPSATTPTTVPPPGLGTRYYESDNVANGRVELHAVGNHVVAHVTYELGNGNEVFTGTVTGSTLTATAPSAAALNNPRAHDKLVIRVTHPGEANVTLSYPNNSSGAGAYREHFPAICGLKTDAYRYQSCHALTKP